jgi:hypothetical protein
VKWTKAFRKAAGKEMKVVRGGWGQGREGGRVLYTRAV